MRPVLSRLEVGLQEYLGPSTGVETLRGYARELEAAEAKGRKRGWWVRWGEYGCTLVNPNGREVGGTALAGKPKSAMERRIIGAELMARVEE